MNFRKVMAGVAAAVLTVSMMGVSAGALSADKYIDERKAGSDYFVTVNSDDKKVAAWSVDSGIAASQVYGVRYYIDVKDPSQGYGGGIGINATSNNWESHDWGNADAGKEITSDGKTVELLKDAPVFKDSDAYANFFIQKWWGDFTVTKAEILGKGGEVLSVEEAAPAAEEVKEEEPAAEEAPAEEKKTKKETKEEAPAEEAPAAEEEAAKFPDNPAADDPLLDQFWQWCQDSDNAVYLGAGQSTAWGQSLQRLTYNNIKEDEVAGEDAFDVSVLNPDNVVVVFYASENVPEFILQSWSGGEGWAKVPPVENLAIPGVAVFSYDYMAAMYQSEDFSTVDSVYVGDTGVDLTVFGAYVVNKDDVIAAFTGLSGAPAAEEIEEEEEFFEEEEEEVVEEEPEVVVEEAPVETTAAAEPAPVEAAATPKTGNVPAAAAASVMAVAAIAAVAARKRK